MDCYRVVGENERAAEHAHEVLRLSERLDGTDRSPMRASEARLTLAIVSARNGDLDTAEDWTRKAFQVDRKSIKTLNMVTEELHDELRQHYRNDPAATALREVIQSFYASANDR